MLYVVCLACVLLICVNAELSVRCNDDTNTTNMNFVTLEPSPDHVQVPGRYVLEWCTAAKANKAVWLFHINYNLSFKPDQCKLYIYKNDKKFLAHSRFEESTNINLNCSHVCFSTSVDLIFGACYHIKNQQLTQKHSTESYDQLIYITNNFTNSSILNKSQPYATVSNSEDYVSVQWFMGPVPAADFKMELDTVPKSGATQDVTRNCSNAVHTVACVLRVPPGAYILVFSHKEPWTYGSVAPEDTNVFFNRTGAEAPPLVGSMSVGGAAWWGAAGACGAVALCVSAALLQRRRSRTRSQRCKAEDEAEAEAGVAAKAGGVRVLLLYARDCAALLEVARRLGALLRHVAPDGVYEVHAAGVSAQAARAPAAWLRALVGREDVRVVLLQSPAAACLYAAQLHERGSTLPLARPLVCGRAAPRRPHCGDALLQLALRLMSEGAPPHALPYRKYYVAEISGLEANVVPLVTPQRRYVLPAATALLLHDVAASAPPAPAAPPAPPAHQDRLLQQRDQFQQEQLLERQLAEPLAQFTRAVEELQEYVRENPDYLNDNLIFL